jgi:uncharacterized protein YndB with AHSA1/START domain
MHSQVIDEEVDIAASPVAVWRALTDPDITQTYWGGTRIESDWLPGSMVIYRRDGKITDEHLLKELVPQRLIEHTFRPTFGPFATEPPSLLTLLLSPTDRGTRLHVLHRGFPPASKVYAACKEGWPGILAGLKQRLEV